MRLFKDFQRSENIEIVLRNKKCFCGLHFNVLDYYNGKYNSIFVCYNESEIFSYDSNFLGSGVSDDYENILSSRRVFDTKSAFSENKYQDLKEPQLDRLVKASVDLVTQYVTNVEYGKYKSESVLYTLYPHRILSIFYNNGDKIDNILFCLKDNIILKHEDEEFKIYIETCLKFWKGEILWI